MHVLHVVFEGRWAGPPSRVLAMAPALAAQGVRSTLVAPEVGASWEKEIDTEHCPVLRVPLGRMRATPHPLIQAQWLAGYRGDIRRLRSVIRDIRPDVVHTYGFLNGQAALAARAEGVPVVWHLNDLLTPPMLRKLAPAVLRRYAQAVVADGDAVARAYGLDPTALPGGGLVLHPSYDEARFNEQVRPPPQLRSSWGWPKDAFVFGTVGNVNPAKGYEHLVEAFIRATGQNERIRLVIVGALLETRESYVAALKARLRSAGVESRVHFLGLRLDAPAVLRAVDAYVQASVSETGPATVVEACAMGLPVVATRVGAVSHMLNDGELGIIVPPADPQALATEMVRLAGDPALRERLSRAARASVEARFGSQAAAKSLVGLYSRLGTS